MASNKLHEFNTLQRSLLGSAESDLHFSPELSDKHVLDLVDKTVKEATVLDISGSHRFTSTNTSKLSKDGLIQEFYAWDNEEIQAADFQISASIREAPHRSECLHAFVKCKNFDRAEATVGTVGKLNGFPPSDKGIKAEKNEALRE